MDWFKQIMLYSHWSIQTWRSKHARVAATNKAVLCTLMTLELAVGMEQNFGMSVKIKNGDNLKNEDDLKN